MLRQIVGEQEGEHTSQGQGPRRGDPRRTPGGEASLILRGVHERSLTGEVPGGRRLPTQGQLVLSPAEKTDHLLCPSCCSPNADAEAQSSTLTTVTSVSALLMPGGLHGREGIFYHLTGDNSLKATINSHM